MVSFPFNQQIDRTHACIPILPRRLALPILAILCRLVIDAHAQYIGIGAGLVIPNDEIAQGTAGLINIGTDVYFGF